MGGAQRQSTTDSLRAIAVIRAWGIQFCWSPGLSLGFHVDHTGPSVTLHLPGVILAAGRLKQPGFRRCDHIGVETLLERRVRLGLSRRSVRKS